MTAEFDENMSAEERRAVLREIREQVQRPIAERELWALAHIPLGSVTNARLVQVIEVESVTGLGIDESPVRRVTQWFLPDGTEIGKHDPTEGGPQ